MIIDFAQRFLKENISQMLTIVEDFMYYFQDMDDLASGKGRPGISASKAIPEGFFC